MQGLNTSIQYENTGWHRVNPQLTLNMATSLLCAKKGTFILILPVRKLLFIDSNKQKQIKLIRIRYKQPNEYKYSFRANQSKKKTLEIK